MHAPTAYPRGKSAVGAGTERTVPNSPKGDDGVPKHPRMRVTHEAQDSCPPDLTDLTDLANLANLANHSSGHSC